MSFFKNINIGIEDRPAGSKVQIGDAGKMTYDRVLELNFKIAISEYSKVIDAAKLNEIIVMCNKFNILPRFDNDGIYIQNPQKIYESGEEINFLPHYIVTSYFNDIYIPYGQSVEKISFDRCEEKYERFYKVEKILNHPDAAHLKRPDAIIGHACKDCAFHGHCGDAPSCITRYIKELRSNDQSLIEDAVYFKYDKKNDKLIKSTTTPCERIRTIPMNMDEWSKSLSANQCDKH